MDTGVVKFDDILSQSNIQDKKLLADILAQLLNIEIIRKEYHVNTESTNENAYYLINDNLLPFYFKYYVPPQCLKRMPYIKLGCRRVGEYSENHPPLKWPLDLL